MCTETAKALAIEALDAIEAGDEERMHGRADDILLAAVDPAVRAAYQRVQDRADWWASA